MAKKNETTIGRHFLIRRFIPSISGSSEQLQYCQYVTFHDPMVALLDMHKYQLLEW